MQLLLPVLAGLLLLLLLQLLVLLQQLLALLASPLLPEVYQQRGPGCHYICAQHVPRNPPARKTCPANRHMLQPHSSQAECFHVHGHRPRTRKSLNGCSLGG